ncbi:hypothetical protein KKD80_01380 [Patescibacteria group bacterium]|nr:hypothetical protein [Patescibacteria group bacterium]
MAHTEGWVKRRGSREEGEREKNGKDRRVEVGSDEQGREGFVGTPQSSEGGSNAPSGARDRGRPRGQSEPGASAPHPAEGLRQLPPHLEEEGRLARRRTRTKPNRPRCEKGE